MSQRPLGALERALLLSNNRAALNVVAVIQLDSPPAPGMVAEALAAAQQAQPALRARIESRSGRPYFVELQNPLCPLTSAGRPGDDAWLSLAESQLNHRLDANAGPLFRCTYLFSPHHAELVFTFQHTIVDAPSIASFLDGLLSRIAGQRAGPERQPDFVPVPETRFPAAFRGARLGLRALGFASRQIADELKYQWQVRGLRRAAVHHGASARLLSAQTDATLTAALVRRARKEQVTLNSLLNTAMLLAVHRRLYGGQPRPMRTISFPNLRPFLPSPDSLAAYFSMLRYTVQLSGRTSLWEVARALHTQIYTSLKRGDKYVALVMSEPLIRMFTKMRSMRMAMTALSYTGAPLLQAQYGSTRVRGVHAFISNVDFGPEYTAQVTLFDERLVWDIVYLDGDMDFAQAASIADDIQDILRAAVAVES